MKNLTKKLKLLEDKNWVYIGVWEKDSTKKRLHFHGIFYIPENAMVGTFYKRKDFNTQSQRAKTINVNTFFEINFGRNDFAPISNSEKRLNFAKEYIARQLEKPSSAVISSKDLNPKFRRQLNYYELESKIKELDKMRNGNTFARCDERFIVGDLTTKETVKGNNLSFAVRGERKRNSLAGKGNTLRP